MTHLVSRYFVLMLNFSHRQISLRDAASSSTSINLKIQNVAAILNEKTELFDVKDIDDR
jgi:hypothetical protein